MIILGERIRTKKSSLEVERLSVGLERLKRA
jgi:hypothetical protein